MDKKKIRSFVEYIELIQAIYGELNPKKFLFFRGHASVKWDLLPSVLRSKHFDEKDLVLDYKQIAPAHTFDYSLISDIDKILVEMQHSELPTRLLDWTFAPLSALFFACQPNKETEEDDAVVYVLNPWNIYPQISLEVCPNRNRPSTYMDINVISRCLLSLKWSDVEIYKYIRKNWMYDIQPSEYKFPLPFIAKFRNDRIIAQRGAFVLWGGKDDKLDIINLYDDNMIKIVIKAENKNEIFDMLNLLYINEYTQYPDLKGIKDLINRKYGLFNR